MILLDTHVWIWNTADRSKLSDAARDAIEQSGALGLSAISAWELATLVRKKRIRLDRDVREWMALSIVQWGLRVVPMTAEIAARAGLFDALHGDPADRIIVATAIETGCPLVTCDDQLRKSEVVTTIW